MQTFLPHYSITKSVACLDNKRLGKQRVEALQIVKALTLPEYGWQGHPAVKMWKGYTIALQAYHDATIDEWVKRGFNNTMHKFRVCPMGDDLPPWLGDPAFHASHRSNLLRKDPKHYGQFGWIEPDNLPYFWPTKEGY